MSSSWGSGGWPGGGWGPPSGQDDGRGQGWGPPPGEGGVWDPPPRQGGSGNWGPPRGPQWSGGAGPDFGSRPTTSMVLGIVGLLCCAPAGIAAVVIGEQVRRDARSQRAPMPGKAIAGYVLGCLSIAYFATVVLYLVTGGDA
jgi:hypothetical protein